MPGCAGFLLYADTQTVLQMWQAFGGRRSASAVSLEELLPGQLDNPIACTLHPGLAFSACQITILTVMKGSEQECVSATCGNSHF